MTTIPVKVPDIGDASDVDVVEVLVGPGSKVDKEQSLIVLSSDKASMEIPSPTSGVVAEVKLTVGDKVSQGTLILTLESANDTAPNTDGSSQAGALQKSAPDQRRTEAPATVPAAPPLGGVGATSVDVPDIGDVKDVEVVEVLVQPGSKVDKEQSLIVLSSDKASMEIPSPASGVVTALNVAVGDKVSKGSPILMLEMAGDRPTALPATIPDLPPAAIAGLEEAASAKPAPSRAAVPAVDSERGRRAYATPSVRKLARELGVDLIDVRGTGPHGRVTREDVQGYVKHAMSTVGSQTGSGFAFPAQPVIDFSQFGEVTVEQLTKIQRISGQNLHRSWISVPHVTQFDQADITELEAFRKQLRAERSDVKMTVLPFFMKALVAALKRMPRFNASLDPSGENLIMKHYFHIGVAVDTDNGLVVPVVRDVDLKGLVDLAKELSEVSERARRRRLSPRELQGASMTISSLGGIGGTAFTPIINPPEVAILGVSRAEYQPVYKDGAFVPRLMCPLSLSYDHRVIDGAYAVRFTSALREVLGDIRQMLL